jgi:hypothetical protein
MPDGIVNLSGLGCWLKRRAWRRLGKANDDIRI